MTLCKTPDGLEIDNGCKTARCSGKVCVCLSERCRFEPLSGHLHLLAVRNAPVSFSAPQQKDIHGKPASHIS